MDDHLVARWRRGDASAAPMLRRHLGGLAAHLWEHSAPAGLGLSAASGHGNTADSAEVRIRVVGIVREALASDARSVADLKDQCIRATARQRVNALLAQEGGHHPSVELLVAHGLRSGTGRGPDEIESHLPLCAGCTEALRTIGFLRRAAESWTPDEDVSDEVTDRVAKRRRRRSRKREPKYPWPSPFAAWPLVMIAGLLLWWGWNRSGGEVSIEVDNRYAGLVDRTPPAPPPPSSLPAAALDAVRDLRKGDCFSASARLRATRRRVPDHVDLRLLEGAAFVCIGDGEEALDAVGVLHGKVGGGEVPWTLARAHLLMGQPGPARGYLDEVVRTDTVLRGRAQAMLIRMAEVKSGRTEIFSP